MLHLRSLELDRQRIAMRRKPVDDRPPRIAQPKQLSDLVKRLSRRIVARVSYIAVGPKIFMHLGKIKMRMSTRDHQSEHREMKLAVFALTLLQQYRMNVPFQMVDGDQWFPERKGKSLGKADPHEQSARQSRPLRDRNSIDRRITLPCLSQGLAHHRNNRPQVLTRSEFRHHSPKRLMSGNLRGDGIRQNLPP